MCNPLFQAQQGISFVYRAKDRYKELLEPIEGGDLTPPHSAGITLRRQGGGCNEMQDISKVSEWIEKKSSLIMILLTLINNNRIAAGV